MVVGYALLGTVSLIHERDPSIPSTSGEPDHSNARAPSVRCPECEGVFNSSVAFAVHCENNHANDSLDFTVFDIHFSSWRSFEVWKERKEQETFTKLVRRTTRRSGKGTTHMYACQHSARASGKRDSGREKKRRKKCIRTSKHCPCFAKATQNLDESVDVLACFGHLGHKIVSADLPISYDDEMVIRSMLLSGFSSKEIVAQLHQSEWNEDTPAEKQPRLCFLTTRDVNSIAARHGILPSGSSAGLQTMPQYYDEYEDEEEEVEEYHESSDEEIIVT
ncbi:hypothetical protein OESDEN_20156 [Oesophagostomum dentatum]|uniref:C2H2-type domain-containing protein n=1 Tax=Oesophagostomum dentatum TaxID=61180 RepID=A0A0B1S8H8_OESDE|nr:hypothetical protein OESDEN_20156 [Oesophagostomum dentatum]